MAPSCPNFARPPKNTWRDEWKPRGGAPAHGAGSVDGSALLLRDNIVAFQLSRNLLAQKETRIFRREQRDMQDHDNLFWEQMWRGICPSVVKPHWTSCKPDLQRPNLTALANWKPASRRRIWNPEEIASLARASGGSRGEYPGARWSAFSGWHPDLRAPSPANTFSTPCRLGCFRACALTKRKKQRPAKTSAGGGRESRSSVQRAACQFEVTADYSPTFPPLLGTRQPIKVETSQSHAVGFKFPAPGFSCGWTESRSRISEMRYAVLIFALRPAKRVRGAPKRWSNDQAAQADVQSPPRSFRQALSLPEDFGIKELPARVANCLVRKAFCSDAMGWRLSASRPAFEFGMAVLLAPSRPRNASCRSASSPAGTQANALLWKANPFVQLALAIAT